MMQFDGSLEYLRTACAYIYEHIEDFSFIDISVDGNSREISIETNLCTAVEGRAVDYDEVREKFNMFLSALDDDTIVRASFARTYWHAEAYMRAVDGQTMTMGYEFKESEPTEVAPESITELA